MRTILFPLALLFLVDTAHAEEDAPTSRGATLTVRGSGHHERRPDFANLVVSVTTLGKTLAAATQAHSDRATQARSFLSSLKGEGLEIDSSGASVGQDQPSSHSASDKPLIRQYKATTHFYVKIKTLENLNAIATRIVESGLFTLGGLTFKSGQERDALNAARRAAVLDAREQAATYADAADVKLVEITAIADGETREPSGYADLPRRANNTVQIIAPNELTFEGSVTLTWRIAPR